MQIFITMRWTHDTTRSLGGDSTYQEDSRGQEAPVQRPPLEEHRINNFVANHGTDIVGESLVAINPTDSDALHQAEDEQ